MYHQKPLLGELPDFLHPLTPNVGAWLLNEGSGAPFDCINKKFGTIVGTIPWGVCEQGLHVALDDTESIDYIIPQTSITEGTLMAIAQFTGVHYQDSVLSTSTTNTGLRIQWGMVGAVNDFTITKGGAADISSGIALSSNTWYLLMASSSDVTDTINFLVKNLDTYSIETASTTNTSASLTGSGIACFGENAFADFGWNGDISMGAIWDYAMNINQMQAFSFNPYCWMAEPTEAELFYAAPPAGAVMNQFQRANLGADLYDGVLIT